MVSLKNILFIQSFATNVHHSNRNQNALGKPQAFYLLFVLFQSKCIISLESRLNKSQVVIFLLLLIISVENIEALHKIFLNDRYFPVCISPCLHIKRAQEVSRKKRKENTEILEFFYFCLFSSLILKTLFYWKDTNNFQTHLTYEQRLYLYVNNILLHISQKK